MPPRSTPRSRRSRKRRPQAAAGHPAGLSVAADERVEPSGARPAQRSQGSQRAQAGQMPVRSTFGERPHAPWHPLPLSELLILIGAVAAVFGVRQASEGGSALLVGLAIAVVMIGTFEVTLREHRSGYRSHTLILSVMPVIVMHSAIVLGVGAFTRVPRALNLALPFLDLALLVVLFKLLRANFLDARRERAFRGR